MHRPLGTFETALTLTGQHAPFVVVTVLQLAGGPSPQRLRQALVALQVRQPMLRLRIVERSGGFGFEPAAGRPIPLRQIDRRDDATWRGVAEAELNERIDIASGPLLRCAYVAPANENGSTRAQRGRSELVLTFHHTVMDAVSGAPLLRQLLTLCEEPEGEPELADGSTLPPVEERFPSAARGVRGGWRLLRFLGRQLVDEMSYRLRSRGARKPPIVEPARCRVLPVELSEAESARLVRSLRRERVTLNAALSAALLLAAYRHLYSGESETALRYITFANLRPYLRPPVPDDHLGCAIVMLRYTARLGPGRGFWRLAHEIAEQADAGVRRGDKFCAVRLSERMMRMILGRGSERMAATAVSYSGVTRLGERYGSIGVRGTHAFVSNLGLGPEYTAQARWFRNRLQLDVVYLESDMDETLARVLADEVLDTLRDAARGRTAQGRTVQGEHR